MAIPTAHQPINQIVAYLFTRRETILNNWRTACEQDPMLGKVSALSREEFTNLLPIILDILEQRLLGKPPIADPALTASSHGLHRWHKAHSLLETMQELNHLGQILHQQLQGFQDQFPQTDAQVFLQAQQEIAWLMNETTAGSVQKYDELQRLEAADRAATLHQALTQMEELSRQRGDMLRTSSHDLRGSFGLINSAAYLLKTENMDESERVRFMDMLSRNLATVHTMLDGLMDLSRLEAGAETLQIQRINAAQLLREMVASLQPMATERGLLLQADGPASLEVDTDPIKLQRIVQNLVLNAIKFTPAGFISVSWSSEGNHRWVLGIQDSGPGLPNPLTHLFAKQLRPTVEPTATTSPSQEEPTAVLPSDEHVIPPGPALGQLANRSPNQGEGVGLQIVKRSCDLLDANLDIEAIPNRGTLFRMRFPIYHEEVK